MLKTPSVPSPGFPQWAIPELAFRAFAKFHPTELANLTLAYRAAYMTPSGSFGTSQTANILALYLNLTVESAVVALAVRFDALVFWLYDERGCFHPSHLRHRVPDATV